MDLYEFILIRIALILFILVFQSFYMYYMCFDIVNLSCLSLRTLWIPVGPMGPGPGLTVGRTNGKLVILDLSVFRLWDPSNQFRVACFCIQVMENRSGNQVYTFWSNTIICMIL